LLDDMRELVRDELSSHIARRIEASAREYDVVADRIGVRADLMCGARRELVGMNAHAAEVMREALFHRCACVEVERTAGSSQRFVDDRWTGGTSPSRKSLH